MTRPASDRAADAAALRAIAQACVNVELFTIPLYMVALYSIHGMRQITGDGTDFYANRLWPGAATTANPKTSNEKAFNILFSVFIEEMLHLQLAANIASALGVTPLFTSPALQDDQHGWICYTGSVIPHVVDLKDTTHHGATVALDAITSEQLDLFLIIEESESTSRDHITAPDKYFPSVPFDNWTTGKTEVDLPMFGTIGWMYQCYYDYLSLTYDDGKTLWEHCFIPDSIQNDLYNVENKGHPQREYRGFFTTVTANNPTKALMQVLAMINAITDQGEGSVRNERLGAGADLIADRYQASYLALVEDYPSHTDTGNPTDSADAAARYDYGDHDHYERFEEITTLLPGVVTWPDWLATHQTWKPEDLLCGTPSDPYGLPNAATVADALNQVSAAEDVMYPLFSRAAVGSIAGTTTVLDAYWSKSDVTFPYPAMLGAGDRLSLCWALFGQPPDLSVGAAPINASTTAHACQGLDVASPGNSCAALEVYHSCRGSNSCANQGGCGFVQKLSDSTSCGFALIKAKTATSQTGTFSTPSDHVCATLGGCAVPISAAQLFVQSGTMQIVDKDGNQLDTMTFHKGEKVYDVAARAYQLVSGNAAPSEPNLVRLVFPPSR